MSIFYTRVTTFRKMVSFHHAFLLFLSFLVAGQSAVVKNNPGNASSCALDIAAAVEFLAEATT